MVQLAVPTALNTRLVKESDDFSPSMDSPLLTLPHPFCFSCFPPTRLDNSCISVVFVFFFHVMSCFFSYHIVFKVLYRFWHIFPFIHTILTYSYIHIVFILLYVSCHIFYRVLIFFFLFISCNYIVSSITMSTSNEATMFDVLIPF